jgi:CD109 antigen
VTLFNSDQEFEFLEPKEEENDVTSRQRRSVELQRKKRILVKSNEGFSLTFMIRALKIGKINIKATAESQNAGDGFEKKLLVEPEGIPKYKNEAMMINLKDNEPFKSSISISVPNTAVPDSTRIEAAVSGDILGSSIENLDSLM